MHNIVHSGMPDAVQAFEVPAVCPKKVTPNTCYGNR